MKRKIILAAGIAIALLLSALVLGSVCVNADIPSGGRTASGITEEPTAIEKILAIIGANGYSVNTKIGLASTCYEANDVDHVLSREHFENDDEIQLIDYVANSDGIGFSSITGTTYFRELNTNQISQWNWGEVPNFRPYWTQAFVLWGDYCGDGFPVSDICTNCEVEIYSHWDYPVNMDGPKKVITIGDPDAYKKGHFSYVSDPEWITHAYTSGSFKINFTVDELDPYSYYRVRLYTQNYERVTGVTYEKPNGEFISTLLHPPSEYYGTWHLDLEAIPHYIPYPTYQLIDSVEVELVAPSTPTPTPSPTPKPQICEPYTFRCDGKFTQQCDPDGGAWSTLYWCRSGCNEETGKCYEPSPTIYPSPTPSPSSSPSPLPTTSPDIPGFGVVVAIAGLLTCASLLMRGKRIRKN